MKSAIFSTLFIMAGMTAALVVVNDPSKHAPARVYVAEASAATAAGR